MAGVFDWEYLDAPQDKTNPTIWTQSFKNLKTNQIDHIG